MALETRKQLADVHDDPLSRDHTLQHIKKELIYSINIDEIFDSPNSHHVLPHSKPLCLSMMTLHSNAHLDLFEGQL